MYRPPKKPKQEFKIDEGLADSINMLAQLKQEDNQKTVTETEGPTVVNTNLGQSSLNRDLLTQLQIELGGGYSDNDAQNKRDFAQMQDNEFSLVARQLPGNIISGIVETAGLIGELGGYGINELTDKQYEADFTNGLTEWAKGLKEGWTELTGEEVVKEDDEFSLNSFTDQAWWATSGGGLVESIIEFGATGMGVGTALSKGATLTAKAIGTGAKGLQYGAQLTTAATLAYAEGAMVGADLYKKSYNSIMNANNLTEANEKGYATVEEYAKARASEVASTGAKLSTGLNTLLQWTGVSMLFNKNAFFGAGKQLKSRIADVETQIGRKLTQSEKNELVRELSSMEAGKISQKYFGGSPADIKTLTLDSKSFALGTSLEAGQEAIEETNTLFAEKVAQDMINDDKIEAGFISNIAKITSYFDKVGNMEGLEAAMLGAIGGTGQKAIMEGAPDLDAKGYKTNYASAKERQKEAFYQGLKSFSEDMKKIAQTQKMIKEELLQDDPDVKKIKYLQDDMFNGVAMLRSLRNGTAEAMVAQLEEISLVDNKIDLKAQEIEKISEERKNLTAQGKKASDPEMVALDERLNKVKSMPSGTMAMRLGLAEKPDGALNQEGEAYKSYAQKKIQDIKEASAKYDDAITKYSDGTPAGNAYAEAMWAIDSKIKTAKDRANLQVEFIPFAQLGEEVVKLAKQQLSDKKVADSDKLKAKEVEIKTKIENTQKALEDAENEIIVDDKKVKELEAKIANYKSQYDTIKKSIIPDVMDDSKAMKELDKLASLEEETGKELDMEIKRNAKIKMEKVKILKNNYAQEIKALNNELKGIPKSLKEIEANTTIAIDESNPIIGKAMEVGFKPNIGVVDLSDTKSAERIGKKLKASYDPKIAEIDTLVELKNKMMTKEGKAEFIKENEKQLDKIRKMYEKEKAEHKKNSMLTKLMGEAKGTLARIASRKADVLKPKDASVSTPVAPTSVATAPSPVPAPVVPETTPPSSVPAPATPATPAPVAEPVNEGDENINNSFKKIEDMLALPDNQFSATDVKKLAKDYLEWDIIEQSDYDNFVSRANQKAEAYKKKVEQDSEREQAEQDRLLYFEDLNRVIKAGNLVKLESFLEKGVDKEYITEAYADKVMKEHSQMSNEIMEAELAEEILSQIKSDEVAQTLPQPVDEKVAMTDEQAPYVAEPNTKYDVETIEGLGAYQLEKDSLRDEFAFGEYEPFSKSSANRMGKVDGRGFVGGRISFQGEELVFVAFDIQDVVGIDKQGNLVYIKPEQYSMIDGVSVYNKNYDKGMNKWSFDKWAAKQTIYLQNVNPQSSTRSSRMFKPDADFLAVYGFPENAVVEYGSGSNTLTGLVLGYRDGRVLLFTGLSDTVAESDNVYKSSTEEIKLSEVKSVFLPLNENDKLAYISKVRKGFDDRHGQQTGGSKIGLEKTDSKLNTGDVLVWTKLDGGKTSSPVWRAYTLNGETVYEVINRDGSIAIVKKSQVNEKYKANYKEIEDNMKWWKAWRFLDDLSKSKKSNRNVEHTYYRVGTVDSEESSKYVMGDTFDSIVPYVEKGDRVGMYGNVYIAHSIDADGNLIQIEANGTYSKVGPMSDAQWIQFSKNHIADTNKLNKLNSALEQAQKEIILFQLRIDSERFYRNEPDRSNWGKPADIQQQAQEEIARMKKQKNRVGTAYNDGWINDIVEELNGGPKLEDKINPSSKYPRTYNNSDRRVIAINNMLNRIPHGVLKRMRLTVIGPEDVRGIENDRYLTNPNWRGVLFPFEEIKPYLSKDDLKYINEKTAYMIMPSDSNRASIPVGSIVKPNKLSLGGQTLTAEPKMMSEYGSVVQIVIPFSKETEMNMVLDPGATFTFTANTLGYPYVEVEGFNSPIFAMAKTLGETGYDKMVVNMLTSIANEIVPGETSQIEDIIGAIARFQIKSYKAERLSENEGSKANKLANEDRFDLVGRVEPDGKKKKGFTKIEFGQTGTITKEELLSKQGDNYDMFVEWLAKRHHNVSYKWLNEKSSEEFMNGKNYLDWLSSEILYSTFDTRIGFTGRFFTFDVESYPANASSQESQVLEDVAPLKEAQEAVEIVKSQPVYEVVQEGKSTVVYKDGKKLDSRTKEAKQELAKWKMSNEQPEKPVEIKEEVVKPTEPIPSSKPDVDEAFDKNKKLKLDFSRLKGTGKTDVRTSLEWIATRLGDQVSVQFFQGLIDNDALGAFDKAGRILLSEQADEGVAYHEAFEFIWHTYLSTEEQNALLEELRGRSDYGKTEKYTRVEEAYSNDNQFTKDKEFLAEEFREYVLSGGSIKIPQGKQKSFFRKLYDMLKAFFGLQPKITIADVYSRIEKGAYKASYISPKGRKMLDRSSSDIAKAKLTLSNELNSVTFDTVDTEEILSGFNILFMDNLFVKGNADRFITSSKEDGDATDVYRKTKQEFIRYVQRQLNAVVELMGKTQDQGRLARMETMKNKLNKLLEMVNSNQGWLDLVKAHATYMSSFGIKMKSEEINLEDSEDVLNDSIEEGDEDAPNELGDPDSGGEQGRSDLDLHIKSSFMFDTKDTMPNAVKMLLSSIYNEEEGNKFGLPTAEPFAKMYSILMNNLVGVPMEMLPAKMQELGKTYWQIATLNKMLYKDTANMTRKEKFGVKKLQLEFYQTFNKTRNEFIMNEVNAVTSADYEDGRKIIRRTSYKVRRVNLNRQSSYEKFLRNANTVFMKNREEGREVGSGSVARLEYLGAYELASIVEAWQQDATANRDNLVLVNATLNGLFSAIKADTKSLRQIQNSVRGYLTNLVNLQVKYGQGAEDSFINGQGKRVYASTLNTYLTMIVNRMNNILDRAKTPAERKEMLIKELPFVYNSFSRNSVWLSNFFKGEKLRIGFKDAIVGKETRFNEGAFDNVRELGKKHISETGALDKLVSDMIDTLNGSYTYLRAAERSVENFISSGDKLIAENDEGAINFMIGVFVDEMVLLSDFWRGRETMSTNGWDNDYFRKNRWDEKKDAPRFTLSAEIFGESITGRVADMIKSGMSVQEIATKLRSPESIKYLTPFAKKKLDLMQKEMEDKLEELGTRKDEVVSLIKTALPNNPFGNDILRMYAFNAFAGYVEVSRLFVGDATFYEQKGDAGMVDFTKRMSGANGTKKTSMTGEEHYKDLEEILGARPDGKPYNGKENVIVFEDPKDLVSKRNPEMFEMMRQEAFNKYKSQGMSDAQANEAAKNYMDAYEGYKPADAQAMGPVWAVRELLFSNGDWYWEQEMIYENEMKIYDLLLAYENEISLDKKQELMQEIIKVKNEHKTKIDNIGTQKTQYYGPISNRSESASALLVPALYKHSISVILPSETFVIQNGEIKFRKRWDLLNTLRKHQIGLAQFKSAVKTGTRVNKNGKPQKLYNEDGSIANIDPTVIQDLDYRFFGPQLDMSPVKKTEFTDGTQARALFANNLFENGVPFNYAGEKPWDTLTEDEKMSNFYYAEMKNFVTELTNIVYDRFQQQHKELGVVWDSKEQGFKMKRDDQGNPIKRDAFVNMLKRNVRGLTENAEASIDEILNNFPIDALITRNQIENMLFSMANKGFIRIKINGSSIPQESSIGWELRGETEYLKFYSKGEDRIEPMEIAMTLPPELVEYADSLDVYDNVGNRIQRGLDRLNDMIKNGQIDEKMITYFGFRIPTQDKNSIEVMKVKEFLPRESGYKVIVPKELVAKTGGDFDIDKMNMQRPVLKFNKENGQIEMVNNAENRMLETKIKLLSRPEMFAQLVAPIDDALFKDIVKQLREIEGKTARKITHSMLFSPISQLGFFLDFLSGKAGVGQVAVHIKQHMLALQGNIRLSKMLPNVFKINTVPVETRQVNKDAQAFAEEVTQAMSEVPTLSALVNQSGYTISELLAGVMNPYVDIAKDPYIFYLNAGPAVANTVLYLIRLGADPTLVFSLTAQPAVKAYIQSMSNDESIVQQALGLSMSLEDRKEYAGIVDGVYSTMKSYDKAVEKKVKNGATLKEAVAELEEMYNETIAKAQEKLNNYSVMKGGVEGFGSFLRAGMKGELQPMQERELVDIFLELQRQAKHFQEFVKATQQDTKGLGKNRNEYLRKWDIVSSAKDSGFIANPDDIYKNTMLAPFKRTFDMFDATLSTSELYATMKDANITDAIWSAQKNLIKYLPYDMKEKAMYAMQNDLMLYFVHNNNPRATEAGLFERTAKFVAQLKSDEEYMFNPFVENLSVRSVTFDDAEEVSNTAQASIDFYRKNYTPHEKNVITESWENLAKLFPNEMNDLALVAYNQTGIGTGPFSFVDFMPHSIYKSQIQEPIMKGIESLDLRTVDRYLDLFATQVRNAQYLPRLPKDENSQSFGANYVIDERGSVHKFYNDSGEYVKMIRQSTPTVDYRDVNASPERACSVNP